MVLVFDDVTPLIRAQKVAAWREVARRLAHEIKNPLTPIQLCAERLRRHFSQRAGADARARRRVHDDDRRRSRIAEGAGRRVLAVRAHAGAAGGADRPARAARRRAGAVSRAASPTCEFGTHFADVAAEGVGRPGADPPRDHQPRRQRDRGDGPQRRRSTSRRSTIAANSLVRIVVADDGPGIPPAERDKLFLPYYSTKRRGSGLGLAIVRRIVAEHGGSIDVGDNSRAARGSRSSYHAEPCIESSLTSVRRSPIEPRLNDTCHPF